MSEAHRTINKLEKKKKKKLPNSEPLRDFEGRRKKKKRKEEEKKKKKRETDMAHSVHAAATSNQLDNRPNNSHGVRRLLTHAALAPPSPPHRAMPVGGHSSLLDELDELEGEDELQTQEAAAAAAVAVRQNQLPLQAHALHVVGTVAAAAIPASDPGAVAAEAAIPAHTPLAKYLQRLAGAPEEEEEEAPVTDADALPDAEAEDDANAPANAADVPSIPASASAAATPAADAGSSTRASLLSSLLLEMAAPALAAAVLPSHTLSHRSKRWCVRLCVDAAHTADSGDRSDARLQPQLHQLSAQLGQIRLLHLAALVSATLQLLCCGVQLLLAFAQHLALDALLPLLLGSSASPSAVAAPAPIGMQWMPCIYLVLCLVALLNAATAYVSPLR